MMFTLLMGQRYLCTHFGKCIVIAVVTAACLHVCTQVSICNSSNSNFKYQLYKSCIVVVHAIECTIHVVCIYKAISGSIILCMYITTIHRCSMFMQAFNCYYFVRMNNNNLHAFELSIAMGRFLLIMRACKRWSLYTSARAQLHMCVCAYVTYTHSHLYHFSYMVRL